MSQYSEFRISDGVFTSFLVTGQRPADTASGAWIDGAFDYLRQRVDMSTGKVIDYQPPAPPNSDFQTWSWNADTKLWVAVPTLAQHQSDKTSQLFAASTTAIAQSVIYTSAGGITKLYQADPVSRGNVADMLLAFGATGMPQGFYWVAADNTKVPFMLADVQGLAAAMGIQGFTAFAVLQTLKTAVQAATDIATLDAIVWPAT